MIIPDIIIPLSGITIPISGIVILISGIIIPISGIIIPVSGIIIYMYILKFILLMLCRAYAGYIIPVFICHTVLELGGECIIIHTSTPVVIFGHYDDA